MGELVPKFPILSGLSILLVLLPMPYHWKTRNTGTLLYIAWTVLGNVVFMTNTIVWAGNWEDHAPVWCDISTKIIVGQSVGITAASLCINRKLYNIACMRAVSESVKSKRRNATIDLLLGIGLPLVVMALHYVVQSHRYEIIEDIGCWPNSATTLLTLALIFIWPIIIGVASLIYCSLSIRAFLQIRQQFNQALKNSNSDMTMSQFFRLMALASTEILFSLPFALYLLTTNLQQHFYPWISWEDTHQRFSTIIQVPMIILKSYPDMYNTMMVNLWVLPGGGFLFFIYFGLGSESLDEYKRIFYKISAPLGIKPKPKQLNQTSGLDTHLTSGNTAREGRDRTLFPSLPDLNESLEKNADLEAGGFKSNAV